MPQDILKFTGINRKVNEFQRSGACEELINLRPEVVGGHRVIKPKNILYSNVDYDQFYMHSWGDVNNEIVVTNGIIYWNNAKNDNDRLITSEFDGESVSITHAGNILVIYCENADKQLVFRFKDDKYNTYNLSINRITDLKVRYTYSSPIPAASTATASSETTQPLHEAMVQAFSAFTNKYPRGLAGVSLIGCSYQLNDGSEIWSTAFVVANATNMQYYRVPKVDGYTVSVYGASRTFLDFTFEGLTESEDVKYINIYATRPLLPYEIKFVETAGAGADNKPVKLSLESLGLEGQVMYHVGRIEPNLLTASYEIMFQGMEGNNIMNVNAGCIERIGDVVSYNNRFHYSRSKVEHVIQFPTSSAEYTQNVSGADETTTKYWVAYVYLKDKWKIINKVYELKDNRTHDIVYPMLNVKKVAFVKVELKDDGTPRIPFTEMFYVTLKNSTAYNYSYAFDVTPEIVDATEFELIVDNTGQAWGDFDRTIIWEKEFNAINVSAQYNPFVFPVEYSYSFGGEILDVKTSYFPIISTSSNTYPINVFTSNGIYALEQGNGSTLYNKVVTLQPQVINGEAKATPNNTFFMSSKNLYALFGDQTANVSQALEGERETTIREHDSYNQLCFSKGDVLFDFSKLMSNEDFEVFTLDPVLTYDQLQNELYISSKNQDIQYSYVFNLNTKTYHKIGKRYLESQNGARYVIEIDGDKRNVVDLSTEVSSDLQPILLQSRPIGFGALYSHIQRLILLTDTKLSDKQNLCISVFGSDNLYDWRCIISSQKTNTVLRQIRTNKAAKSYKDYIILINGTVNTSTDLSDIIFDYTVVNRRVG